MGSRTSSFAKLVGAAVVAVVVGVMVGCAAMNMGYGKDGIDLAGARFREGVAIEGSINLPDWHNHITGENFLAELRSMCREQRGAFSHTDMGIDQGTNSRKYAVSCVNIPRDLSRLTNLGTAASAGECAAMAGQAFFIFYHYNPQSRRCAAEWKYEFVGVAETRDICRASTQSAGFPYLVYVSDTKRCFGTHRRSRYTSVAE